MYGVGRVVGLLRRLLIPALAVSLVGCGSAGPSGLSSGTADNDGDKVDASNVRAYESPGGTSGLNIAAADNGPAALKSFDPGAFVRMTQTPETDEDSVDPAQYDDGGGAPPPPPPDGGDAPPPPPDGGEPPPPDGGDAPPPDGDPNSPPPDGEYPPDYDPNNPPPDWDPNAPPPDGAYPPDYDPNNPPPDWDPNAPPPDGAYPPDYDPNNPPPDWDPNAPPPDGAYPPDYDPNNPPPDWDPNAPPPDGWFPPPPEDWDGEGDWFPPPPPEDWEGDWFPPPPGSDAGEGEWVPPPPEVLYGDGEWFPPPPPEDWEGEWYPPPPPPEGFEEFPEDFFFSNTFDDFLDHDFFVEQGFEDGPPPFEEFPFDAFLEDHSLRDIIPDVPPPFEHGEFGEMEFGYVPPPPPGFPPFPPPPEFIGEVGDFGMAFGPPPDGSLPPGDYSDGAPPPPPTDLPPEFFEFDEKLGDLHLFLEGLEFVPPPPGPIPPDNGPYPPDEGPFPPGEEPLEEGFPPPMAFVPFDEVAELLPDDFLPPDAVREVLDRFGEDHPLIGEGGVVNPELENAMFDHPPVPVGFNGFDFAGDAPQFDDMFTVYHGANIGVTRRGQVNCTFSDTLDDGTAVNFSDTTVIEAVQGAAMPLVEMEPGVYETQWVVNIRQLTNTIIEIGDDADPEAGTEMEQARETLSQMTWTMIIQEVDTDGDGVVDETRVSGSNAVAILRDTVEGGPPEGFPPLPPPPPLVLPLDFAGVLDTSGGA